MYFPITSLHRFYHGKNLSIRNNSFNSNQLINIFLTGLLIKKWSSDLHNYYEALKRLSVSTPEKKLIDDNKNDILKKYLVHAIKFREEIQIKSSSFNLSYNV